MKINRDFILVFFSLLRTFAAVNTKTKIFFILMLQLCKCTTMTAQVGREHQPTNTTHQHHNHSNDSTDIFYRHLKLNELVVTGVTGDTKLKNSTTPVSIVTAKELSATSFSNIIDAIAHQPGISQLSTGSGISKPIIRGLGYNRVVVMSEGVRQEGQQWGDEHGVEVDGSNVHSVEILKGPASLMYGSDAMAGVIILHSQPIMPEGSLQGKVSTEYQTNNGLLGYALNIAGNQHGFVWDASWNGKMAHAYKNKYDGYVPGSQFKEMSGRLMLGLQKHWGHSRLIWTAYHLLPSIIEGERDQTTGELLRSVSLKSYTKQLPYQQVRHYKMVWDNSINLSSGYLKAIIGYQQNRRQEFEEHHHEDEEHEHHHSADEPSLYFKLHTLTYDVRYLTHEWDGWKLSAGLGGMWQQSQNLGEEFLIPSYRLFDIGMYATFSKTLQRWTLNGGLRYDFREVRGEGLEVSGEARFTDFSRNFNGVTGSIGAVWNANEHMNIRLNIARGFRSPNMSELGSNGSHEGSLRYEVGNHDLKPEFSLQADLGVDFTSTYISAQVALFANRIDNYIFLKGQGARSEGRPVYSYTQGDARLLGFEAGVDFHPIHSLHFANTFSYVDALQLHQPEETKHLPYTPAPRWTSEVKWELMHHSHPTIGSHSHQQHHTTALSADNLYLSAALECYLSQKNIYSADQTETATPSYTLINLSAGTDIRWKHKKVAEFHVIVNNLLNRAYQSHLSRLKYTDINNVTGRQGVYNMGRNVTLKLNIPIQF